MSLYYFWMHLNCRAYKWSSTSKRDSTCVFFLSSGLFVCTSFSGFASVSSVVPFFSCFYGPFSGFHFYETVVTTVLLPLAFLLLLSYDCN